MTKTSYIITILILLAIGLWATLGALYIGNKVVTGQVVDSDTGEPVLGAEVHFGQLSGATGTDGRFNFTGLQGPGRLAVEADGYYPQIWSVKWAWWQKFA